jgi:5-methylcytosine-specific restriction enzyme B
MPDSALPRGSRVESLPLDEFLDALNARIASEAGREKQIGHSFLMDSGKPISDAEEFALRFRQEILPLLQEYCYDDYSALTKYLGAQIVDRDAGTIDHECVGDAASLISALASELLPQSSGPS